MRPAVEFSQRRQRSIGGEFELDWATLVGACDSGFSSSFRDNETVSSGRTAIQLILSVLNDSGPVLLPSYLCTSVIQPFLESKTEVTFYEINRDLSINLESFLRQLDSFKPAGVLFINYFGIPVSPSEAEILSQIKDRYWVIEDCAHGSLVEVTEPLVGRIGHFVITSFRKYLPLPDGGVLLNRTEFVLPDLKPAEGAFVRKRFLAKLMRHEFLGSDRERPELEDAYLDLFATAERELDTEVPLRAMSVISKRLLGTIEMSQVIARRRSNFTFLSQAFASDNQLRTIGAPLFDDLQPDISPLVFPIRVSQLKRDALRSQLVKQQVFCPVHWPLPDAIEANLYPESYALSREIIGLPIDQRYDQTDMNVLITRLVEAWDKIR